MFVFFSEPNLSVQILNDEALWALSFFFFFFSKSKPISRYRTQFSWCIKKTDFIISQIYYVFVERFMQGGRQKKEGGHVIEFIDWIKA